MASPPSALDSLRFQLEGRWTHLEQARARETRLLQLLGSWRWRQHQAQWLALLRESRAHEPSLQAVRTYVEERALREQWPREHPGPTTLGELHARRAALRKVIHRRLEEAVPLEDVPFTTLLEELESRALEPAPAPPSREEFILAHGWGLSGARPGRYWLTARRLLWWPWWGVPVQVKPASPRERHRRLRLTFGRHARALKTLLSVQQEFVHAPSSRLDDDTLLVCPAFLCPEGFPTEPRWGVALFDSQHVTFIPTHRPSVGEHVRRLLSKAPPVVDPARLLWHEAAIERLRRLSPTGFDAAVDALCHLRAGRRWTGTRLQPMKPGPEALQFKARGYVLSIPRARQPDALLPFLERHAPHLAKPPAPPRWPGWLTPWTRPLFWHRATIIGGFFLYSIPLMKLFDPAVHLLLGRLAYGVGYLVLAWAYMRYAKARGLSPLLGLVGSTCNMLGAAIVFALSPGKPPERR